MAQQQQLKSQSTNKMDMAAPCRRVLLLAAMVIQSSSTVLIGRYTRSSSPQEELYEISHLILLCEVAKVIVNGVLEVVTSGGRFFERLKKGTWQQPMDTMKLSIPALFYFIQNSLFYVAVGNLSAPVFQVTYQSKLVATAVVSVVMLQRRYTVRQWACLVALSLGVAIVVLGEAREGSDYKRELNQNLFSGLGAVSVSCLCSAYAGVYFEKIVKHNNGVPVSLFMRNMQLAFFSVLFASLQQIFNVKTTEKPFLHGFSTMAWVLVLLQAVGGLLVSAVVKYADNIIKGLATGVSVLLATLLSSLIFGTPLTGHFALGALLVLNSIYFFCNPCPNMKRIQGICMIYFFIFAVKQQLKTLQDALAYSPLMSTAQTSCAVIYSSGTLLKYKDGPLIDTFDEVIRINMADTIGFEDYVGSKTTIRVCHLGHRFSPAAWFANRNESNVKGLTLNLTFEQNKGKHREWERLKQSTVSDWTMAPRLLEDDCNRLVGYDSPMRCSSGLIIVLWAVENCDSVTVFGAVTDRCYPYHYYDAIAPNCSRPLQFKKKFHDFDREHAVLEQLHWNGNVTINRLTVAGKNAAPL